MSETANRPVADRAESGTTPSFHIPSLDGLRAVAVMIVFVSHAGLPAVPGGFGVTVFFFLSGYLITTLLRREFEGTGRIDFGAFYKRRAWRILPPLYLCLALAVLFSAVGFTADFGSLRGVVAQALHVTNYWTMIDPDGVRAFPPGTIVYWSLAVEEHFYLLFPLAALVLLRRFAPRRQALTLLVVCGLVLAWRLVLVLVLDAPQTHTYSATDARIDAILYGCVMGLYRNPALDPVIETTRRTRTTVLAVSGLVILGSMAVRNEQYRETLRYTIQSMALAPVFYFAILHPREGLFRLLNLRPVAFLGVLSYTFYLNHLVYIGGFNLQFPDVPLVLRGVLSFAAILATSLAIHLAVERPIADIRRRLRVATLD
ncbi:MAG: acyltransferase [Actinomycetota bacterium]